MAIIPISNSNRNPASNVLLDPNRNWRINPEKNWRINPKKNWRIDPTRNWQINPAKNWRINPNRNWQVNPNRNWQINPFKNWSINPSRNNKFNPFVFSGFMGAYICSITDNSCHFIAVKSIVLDVMLFYDYKLNCCYYAIGMSDVYSVFSFANFDYVGFLCPNGVGGYNWFSCVGGWKYYFT